MATSLVFQFPAPLRRCQSFHVINTASHTPTRPSRCAATPPRRKGAVANDLRDALQSSLRARKSRIDLVLPPGAALGTETRPKDETFPEQIRAADREVARVVSGMFQGTGLTMRLLFPDDHALTDAKRIWGKTTFDMLSWGSKTKPVKVSKKPSKKTGFGRQNEQSPSSDDSVDVHVLVGGGAAFLARGRRLAEQLGQDKLVILLNANSNADRLPIDLQTFRDQTFETVYYYVPNPHPKWSGGVLFRKFPDDWVLGKLSPIGTLQQLLVTPEKPSMEKIAEALGKEGATPENAFLKKVSGFMNWTDS